LREKSLQLTAYLEYLLQKQLGEYINIFTPSDPSQRGCQLSLHFKSETVSAHEVLHALEAEGIFGDVRKPGVIRIAPTPLYNSFRDVFDFVHILRTTLLHT
jgi:kynureninase